MLHLIFYFSTDLDTVRALLVHHPEVNHLCHNGQSPLHIAILSQQYDIASVLLASDADQNLQVINVTAINYMYVGCLIH